MKTTKILFAALFCACASRPLTASLSTDSPSTTSQASMAAPVQPSDFIMPPEQTVVQVLSEKEALSVVQGFAKQAVDQPMPHEIARLIRAYCQADDLQSVLRIMCVHIHHHVTDPSVFDQCCARHDVSQADKKLLTASFKNVLDAITFCFRTFASSKYIIEPPSNQRLEDFTQVNFDAVACVDKDMVKALNGVLRKLEALYVLASQSLNKHRLAISFWLATLLPYYQLCYLAIGRSSDWRLCAQDRMCADFMKNVQEKPGVHLWVTPQTIKQLKQAMQCIKQAEDIKAWRADPRLARTGDMRQLFGSLPDVI